MENDKKCWFCGRTNEDLKQLVNLPEDEEQNFFTRVEEAFQGPIPIQDRKLSLCDYCVTILDYWLEKKLEFIASHVKTISKTNEKFSEAVEKVIDENLTLKLEGAAKR